MSQDSKYDSAKELKKNILNEFNRTGGTFALVYLELKPKGEHIFISEKATFHAASTMKTPLMIEVFKQNKEGKLNLGDSIVVKNEFKSIVDGSLFSLNLSDDAGEELYQFIGQPKTIKELVYEMITVSSNLATNLLMDIVGVQNVMRTMKSIGAHDIKILRGVEDLKAYDRRMNNTTDAYDLALIYKKLALGELVSKDACEEMIKILLDQKLNNKISAMLPADVKVAHKTGSVSAVEHDSGIIYLPDGRKYILIILSKNLNNSQEGIRTIAKVSRMIYDHVIE